MILPEKYSLTFLVRNGETELLTADGRSAFSSAFEDGRLQISALYDVKDVPLTLSAAAKVGDAAEVRFRPCRIELWVNERLTDEEWPYGQALLEQVEELAEGMRVLPLSEPAEEQPCIIGEFCNAEGWLPGNGVSVGDCMPYYHEGRYHVLYLKDRHHHKAKWGLGGHQWAHISTDDLVHWQIHPMAVEIDEPWQGAICTGSWFLHEGRQYLFYTVRSCDGGPAVFQRSVSDDGYHFRRDEGFSFILSDRYYQEAARDPKIIRAEDGIFHMLVTTSLKSGGNCLAHLVSKDLDHWQEIEPLYVTQRHSQPECTDYFQANGRYYLVFSMFGKAEYRYSEKPFSDWIVPENNEIPCGKVPKMALFHDRILFCGFQPKGEEYGGAMTFLEVYPDAGGVLQSKRTDNRKEGQ